MQDDAKAIIIVLGMDMMQGRTDWVVGFTNSGWKSCHCRIEGFVYVLRRGLGCQHSM